MTFGRHDDYFWIQWERAILRTLLDRVPDLVRGRYLVNTSFDSGSLTLSDTEQQHGWRSVGGLTYSPRIADVHSIPHDQFDEWLVFSLPTVVQAWQPVVNYGGMSLTDPHYESLQEKLWSQIESVRPESYLAEGDRLILITRIQQLHDLALAQKELDSKAT